MMHLLDYEFVRLYYFYDVLVCLMRGDFEPIGLVTLIWIEYRCLIAKLLFLHMPFFEWRVVKQP